MRIGLFFKYDREVVNGSENREIPDLWGRVDRYAYFSGFKTEFFSFQNNPKNLDPSLGLFRKCKTCITAKFYGTDFIICSHSREGKTSSYSQIHVVCTYVSLPLSQTRLNLGMNISLQPLTLDSVMYANTNTRFQIKISVINSFSDVKRVLLVIVFIYANY